jgi:hypothetical protein
MEHQKSSAVFHSQRVYFPPDRLPDGDAEQDQVRIKVKLFKLADDTFCFEILPLPVQLRHCNMTLRHTFHLWCHFQGYDCPLPKTPVARTICRRVLSFSGRYPALYSRAYRRFGNKKAITHPREQSYPINFEMCLVPFLIQPMPASDTFLALLVMSFASITPPITIYCPDWPLLSWIRQCTTTFDAELPKLYDILFPARDVDLRVLQVGVRSPQPPQTSFPPEPRRSPLWAAISAPDVPNCALDRAGLSTPELFDVVERIVKQFADECGLSYRVLMAFPSSSDRFADSPNLVAYVPTFVSPVHYPPNIFFREQLYLLHAVVREEEGLYTASYYSPATRLFYDFRGDDVTPVLQNPPPVCNARERYVMFLYVARAVSEYFQHYAPVAPFAAVYDYVTVYEADGSSARCSLNSLKKDEAAWDYFVYDPATIPFPGTPLPAICGKSVLRMPARGGSEPYQLVWIEGDNRFVPQIMTLPEMASHSRKDHVWVVVEDNYVRQQIFPDKAKKQPVELPVDGIVRMKLKYLTRATDQMGTMLAARFEYGRKWPLEEQVPLLPRMFVTRPHEFPALSDELMRMVPQPAQLKLFVRTKDRGMDWLVMKDAETFAINFDTFGIALIHLLVKVRRPKPKKPAPGQ